VKENGARPPPKSQGAIPRQAGGAREEDMAAVMSVNPRQHREEGQNAVGFDLSPGVSELVRNYAVGVNKVPMKSLCLLCLFSVNKFRVVPHYSQIETLLSQRSSWHSLSNGFDIMFTYAIDT
jgi:hypothetical protein